MKWSPMLLALVSLAGCSGSPCTQPDVLAFVEQARLSRDLYAVGLTDDPVRQTPVASADTKMPVASASGTGVNRRAAVCTAWMLSRNPAFQPGNGQTRYVRQRQDFRVVKLAAGYEVSSLRP